MCFKWTTKHPLIREQLINKAKFWYSGNHSDWLCVVAMHILTNILHILVIKCFCHMYVSWRCDIWQTWVHLLSWLALIFIIKEPALFKFIFFIFFTVMVVIQDIIDGSTNLSVHLLGCCSVYLRIVVNAGVFACQCFVGVLHVWHVDINYSIQNCQRLRRVVATWRRILNCILLLYTQHYFNICQEATWNL